MNILADTHPHSLMSGHAYSTIREMAAAAAKKGLKAMALTEHAPEMPGTSPFRPLAFVPGIGQNRVIIHSNVRFIGGIYGTAEGAHPPGR